MAEKPRIATIGTFDGLHRGHRFLLAELAAAAAKRGMEPLAVTFSNHPLAVIAPDRVPPALSSIAAKERGLRDAGATPLVMPFTPAERARSAADFLAMLRREHGVEAVIVGYDNSFGCDRPAPAELAKAARSVGVEPIMAPPMPGGHVSSSAIRRLIAEGRVEEAADALGRPYELAGTVVHGRAVGRNLGFPTANLSPEPGMAIPAPGVYAATAAVEGLPSQLKAVVNIGSRPTFDTDGVLSIEAHLLDFSNDIYNNHLTLSFIRRLRSEQRFPSPEALARQLALDTEQALKALI